MARKRLFDDEGETIKMERIEEEKPTGGRERFFDETGISEFEKAQEEVKEERKAVDPFAGQVIRKAEPEVEKSWIKKISEKVAPYFLDIPYVLKQPEELDIKENIKSLEDYRQSYLRQQRSYETFKEAGVTPEHITNPEKFISEDYKEPEGFYGSVKEGIIAGYYSSIKPAIGSVVESLGHEIKSPEAIQWGEQYADKQVAYVLKNPELLRPADLSGPFDGGLGDKRWYGRTIGETIPFVTTVIGASTATALSTKNPLIVKDVAFATVMAIEKGNAYRGMIEKGIAPDKASSASSVYGAIAATIENSFGFKPAEIALNATGRNIVKNSYKNFLKNELPKYSKEFLGKVVVEGGEESAQQFSENLVTKWLDESQGLWDGVAESFPAGVVGALPFGGADVLSRIVRKPTGMMPESIEDIKKEVEIPAIERQKELDVAIGAKVTEEKIKEGVTISHGTEVDIEKIIKDGFIPGDNTIKGKAAYFTDSEATKNLYGENKIEIDTSVFNLKPFKTLEEETAFIEKQKAKNLSEAIEKEGTYDGFILINKHIEVGNTYGITNIEKLNSAIRGEKIIPEKIEIPEKKEIPEIEVKETKEATEDWEDNYAEKVGDLSAESSKLANEIKTAKKEEKIELEKKKEKIDKQIEKLEQEWIDKHKEEAPKEKEKIPVDLEGIKRVNPELFRKAQKAETVEEFIKSMGKNVDIPTLTDFFNKVKGIKVEKVVEEKPKKRLSKYEKERLAEQEEVIKKIEDLSENEKTVINKYYKYFKRAFEIEKERADEYDMLLTGETHARAISELVKEIPLPKNVQEFILDKIVYMGPGYTDNIEKFTGYIVENDLLEEMMEIKKVTKISEKIEPQKAIVEVKKEKPTIITTKDKQFLPLIHIAQNTDSLMEYTKQASKMLSKNPVLDKAVDQFGLQLMEDNPEADFTLALAKIYHDNKRVLTKEKKPVIKEEEEKRERLTGKTVKYNEEDYEVLQESWYAPARDENVIRIKNIETKKTIVVAESEIKPITKKYEKPSDIRRGIKREELPSPEEVGIEEPRDIRETDKERGERVARREQPERDAGVRERPGTFKRLTNDEIENLVISKETFTDEEKLQMAEYTGAGGLEKKGEEGRGLLDEYYTPKKIVSMTWDLINPLIENIKQPTIIEPSVGIGSFLVGAPKNAIIYGKEINLFSAKIAKILHPKASIVSEPFETTFITERGAKKDFDQIADIVIGNPPYGVHRGIYKGLGEESRIKRYEEYFLKRSLDITKEEGIVAMVVPSSFLRNDTTSHGKKEIAKMGRLIDARRLPNKAFETTDIGTDIIIFQKEDAGPGAVIHRLSEISNNEYFEKNPEKVFGVEKERKGRFGMEKYIEGKLDDIVEAEILPIDTVIEGKEEVKIDNTESKELGKGRSTTSKKITKDLNEKSVLKSDKKDETIKLTQEIEKEDQIFWDETQATGELSQKAVDKITEKDVNSVNYERELWYNNFNYFQGNIYEKLALLEDSRETISEAQYEKQKNGLEEILPKKKTTEEITLSPGSSFAKEEVKFAKRSLTDGFKEYLELLPQEAFESSDSYEIRGYINSLPVNVGDKVLNIEIRKRRKRIGDSLFKKYIKEELSVGEKEKIEDIYNEKYNNYARPNYSNVPLTAEINNTFKGKKLEVKEIQKEGAGFLVNKGVGLLGYDVGVGKTLTSILSINEMIKKGWSKKPLVIVPNGVYKNWIKEINEIIPDVTINSLANLGAKFKGDLATLEIDDGTVSIISYEGMRKLGFKQETYNELLVDLRDVMSGVNTTKRGKAKETEKIKETLGVAIKGTTDERFFEDLGFDSITIDEVHNFKNIFAGAKMEGKANEYKNVRGTSSARGIKAYLMAQYILEKNNGRGVFALSATPFTNSPMEIYSIISLFAKKRMERMGIKNVNDFMTMFMKLESRFQVKANKKIVEEDTIESFHNLGELQKLIGEYIDFRTGEEAGVERPDKIKRTIPLKPNDLQVDYLDRSQEIYNDKELGGAIAAITEQQKITLSPYFSRYYEGELPNHKEFVENSPKIKQAMEIISQIKKDKPEVGQVIYMPRGIEFYGHIKEYLKKELKYKADQIGEIFGGMSIDQKQRIQDDFNKGNIKILIGSEAIKEGVNLQENSTDLHHLHLPWNPTDMLQVEGRTWRQGSKWQNVRMHYYLIENSVDQFIFQKLETKEKRIKNVWSYTGHKIEVGDLNFEDMKMDLITDPAMRVEAEKIFQTSKEKHKLEILESERSFLERKYSRVSNLESKIEENKEDIKSARDQGYNDDDYYLKNLLRKEKTLARDLVKAKKKIKDVNIAEAKLQEKAKQAEIKEQEKVIEDLDKIFEEKMKKAEEERVEVIVKPNDYKIYKKEIGIENKDFFKKALGPNGSRGASVGKYKDGTPVKTGSLSEILPIQFPDLIHLARQMGSAVRVNRRLLSSRGRFTGEFGIELNKGLFSNTEQATKTLAHEIGHLIDWIPDMKMDRGNILGRIFSLRNFLRGRYGEDKIKNEEYRTELWELSKYWRPLPEEYSDGYLKYRKSSAELYADAISVLLNSPGLLEEKAPNFYKSFFENLDKKPKVFEEFFSLQEELRSGSNELIESWRDRIGGTKGMFKDADYKAVEIQKIKDEENKKNRSIGQLWMQTKIGMFSLHSDYEAKIKEIKKRGGVVNENENPVYYLNERNYVGSKIKTTIEKHLLPSISEIKKHGITQENLGEMLMYERILKGDRGEVANPGGFQKEFIEEMMGESIDPKTRELKQNQKSLKEELGAEKFTILKKQAASFRLGLKKIFEIGYKEGLYNDELYDLMQENKYYVPFRPIKYMDQKTKASVSKKVGTLSDIENPLNTSIEKAMAIVRAVENNKAKRAGLLFLQKEFSEDIKKAKTRYTGKRVEIVEIRNKTALYMKNGKPVGFYVPEYIASSLNNRTTEEIKVITQTIGRVNRKWFKPVFVGVNTGFHVANFARDFFRFWKNIPKMSFVKAFKLYYKAYPHARKKAKTKQDILISEMEEEGILGLTLNDYMAGGTEEDIQNDMILKRIGLAQESGSFFEGRKILKPVAYILDKIREMGDTIEALPKVAGYIHFKGSEAGPKISMKEKDFIRRYVGSPDFFAKGSWTKNTNDVFLFSNAIIQGVRSDYEVATNPETRSEFWWKTSKVTFIPKMLMAAASIGLFGDFLKEIMDEATEYDKTNYIIIPLGKDENKKAVYFRLPQDETSRFLGGMFWKNQKFMTSGDIESLQDVIGLWGGQLPAITPAVVLPIDLFQFATGKNVYDTYRQRTVLTEDQAAAGWEYKAKPVATYVWNQAGGNIFLKLYSGEPTEPLTPKENFLRLPIVSNVVGRFFKVTDYGKVEILRREVSDPIRKEVAEKRMKDKKLINEYVEKVRESSGFFERRNIERDLVKEIIGHKPKGSDEISESKRIIKKLDIAVIKGQSDDTVNSLIYAITNKEKTELLNRYKETMSKTEFSNLRTLLLKHKIVSRDVFNKLNK